MVKGKGKGKGKGKAVKGVKGVKGAKDKDMAARANAMAAKLVAAMIEQDRTPRGAAERRLNSIKNELRKCEAHLRRAEQDLQDLYDAMIPGQIPGQSSTYAIVLKTGDVGSCRAMVAMFKRQKDAKEKEIAAM